MHSLNEVSNHGIKEIIKLHQKKYRDITGLFIAEGFKSLEEIIAENIEIKQIFALKTADINKITLPVSIIDETIMKKISTTSSVCEVLTVAKKQNHNIKTTGALKKLILLDSVNDPGNLGTIIRSASAFDIDGIILYGNCVDLYSPKVIRSTAGNLFKTPVILIKDIEELQKYFKDYTFIATSLSKENNISLEKCADIEKFIIMFGSEAKGLSCDLVNTAEKNIKLNMKKNVESLNLSVSVSIILYELCKNNNL